LIIIVFLIFDVEISILLNLPYQLDFENFKGRIGFIIFVWVLLLGTLEEWRRGVLK
jgi:NADH:ubiquinone oxidoreductase subunit 3 (subunit A)